MHKKLSLGLRTLIDRMGTKAAIAESIGVTPEAVYQWHEIPIRRVIELEKATGVPRNILRPDLYADTISGR